MHDAKGRELFVGDEVMIPCRITALHSSPDFCNVNLELIATMPNGKTDEAYKSTFSAVNTKQLLRAKYGDDLTFSVVQEGAHTVIK